MKADHTVSPEQDDELQIVEGRLAGLSDRVLTPQEWVALFSSAELLIPRAPRKPHRSGKEMDNGDEDIDGLMRFLRSTVDFPKTLAPGDMDLDRFNRAPKGRVLRAVLKSFASSATYEHSQRYSIGHWTPLVSRFYNLTSYSTPPIPLSYVGHLCSLAVKAGYSDAIDFLVVVAAAEPLWVRQVLGAAAQTRMKQPLSSALAECIQQGEDLKAAHDAEVAIELDDYWEWHSSAEELVRLSEAFAVIATQSLEEHAGHLQSLIRSVDAPSEPEEDDDRNDDLTHGLMEYWTVERMFEDL